MKNTVFDFVGNLDTLIAVLVGALLATGGALVAEVVQDRLGRKRRQRDAARFFGEIMVSLDQIFDLACNSQKIGDPWGPLTIRLFDLTLKEAAIYERNRERLFDVNDMELRFAVHGHMLRQMTTIGAMLEQNQEIHELREELEDAEQADGARLDKIRAQIESLVDIRESTLEAGKEEREMTQGLLDRLAELGRVQFDARYR